MKLHEVPQGSRIKLTNNTTHPPAHREFEEQEELEFYHIDGMYSYCKDDAGKVVHLVAWAEVEVIRSGPA